MKTGKRMVLAIAAAAGVLATSGGWMATTAGASVAQANRNNFSLSAQGDGMYFDLEDPSLPATTSVVLSPYSAQASLNSTGKSTAFAGLPYPGPVLATITQTVNGLAGGNLPPLPSLPGFVQSSYPTSPNNRQEQGPLLIEATTGETSASASAGFGLSTASDGSKQISADASVVANDDGTVTASATAGFGGLKLGPLNLLDFRSTATMTTAGTGQPEISSSTNFGTIELLGFKLGIDQDGFKVLGANIPLPTAQILSLVNTVLSSAHVSISFIPSITTTIKDSDIIESFTTGHLQVETVQDVPTQGIVTVRFTVGRVTVSARNAERAATPPTTAKPSGSSGQAAPAAPAPAPTPSRPAPPSPTLNPSAPAAIPPASSPAGGSTAAPLTLGSSGAAPLALGRAALSVPLKSNGAQAVYLLLVLIAVAVFAGPHLIRYVAVQQRLSLRLNR